MHFKARLSVALADATLQANLRKFQSTGFTALRAKAVAEFGPELFEALRGEGAAIRDRSLAHLDAWLERFEAEAVRRGATVLFAETRAEACELLIDICRRHGVRKAIKSKSMLSEEAGVNEALAANGITPIETDLGEYILQLAGEPPSHIIAPALHKSKDEVADLFATHHHAPRKDDIPRMTREAREVLREHFLSADLGISGGNSRGGGDIRARLRCTGCGACLTPWPVYGAGGGHSAGWVSPGPMGPGLTPSSRGLATPPTGRGWPQP